MTEKTLPLILLFTLACSSTNSTARGPAETAPADPRVAEAERLLNAGQFDESLIVTDAILKERNDRAARLIAARGNLALVATGRSGAELFLDDAITQLRAALDLEDDDPPTLLTLAQCYYRKSDFEQGRDIALEAADRLNERHAPSADIGKALLQAADCDMQIFVAARRAERSAGGERPGDDTTELAKIVLARCAAAEQLGQVAAARVRQSQVYRWMNRGTDALQTLETGVMSAPESLELNDALQNLFWEMGMRAECVAAYKRMLTTAKGSSALTWYLGRAEVAHADDLRAKTRWDDAVRAYSDARATFKRYDKLRAADHSGTVQWIAICELSLGRVAFEQGDLDEAKARYFAAYDATPKVVDVDANGVPVVRDSFGGNYLGGLAMIGQALAEAADPHALESALAFTEAVLKRHPGISAAFYNNAGFLARDLGVQIAGEPGDAVEASASSEDRKARLEQAMALWERSYRYYEEAIALAPDDARMTNDCALMLVYHLNRDYGHARELLDRAIQLGEAQLAAMPADAEPTAREFLESAVGDAYENIGVLLADRLGKPFADAKPFFERAVEFYPKQRRAAAQRLRQGERTVVEQDPRKAKFDREIEAGKTAAQTGDFDAALLVIDKLSKEMTGYAPFHYYAGVWSLQFAKATAAAGGADPGLVDGLFQDAVRNLRKAVELDDAPLEPRYELGNALLAAGKPDEAVTTASDLLTHARSVSGAKPEFLAKVHALRAEAGARDFIAKMQSGQRDEELLRTLRTSFREVEPTVAYTPALRALWITAEQWAGAGEQAVQIMVRAWQRDPNLLGDLVALGASAGASQAVVDALGDSEDATVAWYSGKARFDLAVQQWSAGKPKDGIATLDAAIQRFETSRKLNPAFADSCEQWVALCLGQKGIVQLSSDDVAGAETSLRAAVEQRPDVFANDLGGGSSIRRGALLLADRFVTGRNLQKAAEIYRFLGKHVPNDVDIANNEGLFCRDYADSIGGRRGELTDKTRDLYEASYAAYQRAVELDPTNVRLRNDCALILVFSLKRDLDQAEKMLQSALQDGEKQLLQSPPKDAEELRALQEAVGDAYGNLGVLYLDRKDYAKAKQHFEKSLEFYPFRNREGVRRLQQIEELEKAGGDKKGGN